MFKGCYTALITPFDSASIDEAGRCKIDETGLSRLIDFQVENKVSGIVVTGTTGESPTLTWNEHYQLIEACRKYTKHVPSFVCIAGTGSNSTAESIEATSCAFKAGMNASLLIDPYYNGPSSLEIRKESIAPIAKMHPNFPLIPYIIPGRTGTQLLPEDLALLSQQYPNVCAVKEATGNFEIMKKIRSLCGNNFDILSGDDDLTFDMMTSSEIKANGVVSVLSNIIPAAVQNMTMLILEENIKEATALKNAIQPLFKIVTVKTIENTPFGPVECRARNPLAIKTLMSILGMPSGPCRRPLGKVTKNALDFIIKAAKNAYQNDPKIFDPISKFFKVDISSQLNKNWQHLAYESYA